MLHNRHPSLERLTELASGLLGAHARSLLEQHIAQCAGCSAELDRLVRSDQEQAAEPASDGPGPFQRLVGVLRFDSVAMAPAFGVRAGTAPDTRQLLFEAGPFEVELQTAAARTGWSISGQVLGPTDATSGEVRLIGSRANARSELTALLEFKLPVVPAGQYRLELEVGDTACVEIERLEIGS